MNPITVCGRGSVVTVMLQFPLKLTHPLYLGYVKDSAEYSNTPYNAVNKQQYN